MRLTWHHSTPEVLKFDEMLKEVADLGASVKGLQPKADEQSANLWPELECTMRGQPVVPVVASGEKKEEIKRRF